MNQLPPEKQQEVAAMLKQSIAASKVIPFMKGDPNQPQCGFSAKVVQELISIGQPFSYVDILAEPEVRATLPQVSEWPTFPQLFIAGELVGGCDIVTDLAQSGELATMVNSTVDSADAEDAKASSDESE